jgi:MOSC domain-containing protein YiiM
MGATVKHRSRVKRDPSQPNLRQVHLIHGELHDELRGRGFVVHPGEMGENVTTRGVDLLSLPVGTRLHLGAAAVVELTGLRNPCAQLDRIHPGLMAAVLDRDGEGKLIRKAGVMGIVLNGGDVQAADPIRVELPSAPQAPWSRSEPEVQRCRTRLMARSIRCAPMPFSTTARCRAHRGRRELLARLMSARGDRPTPGWWPRRRVAAERRHDTAGQHDHVGASSAGDEVLAPSRVPWRP